MTTLSLSARLDRTDSRTPWGFRMQGGRDYGTQLVITRVTPGSLAAKCGLQVGDAIMKIGDSPTDGLVHKDAQQSIVNGGNSLELSLQRGGGSGLSSPATSAPAYSGSTYGAPQENAGYTPSSNAQQNYNAQPKPFAPGPGGAGGASGAGAGTGPGGSTLPVAVNKQYNTPLQMYSVDNVMDSLATQTAGLNMATPGSSSSSSSELSSHDDTKPAPSTNPPAPSHVTSQPPDPQPDKPAPFSIRPKFVAGAPKPAVPGGKPLFTPKKFVPGAVKKEENKQEVEAEPTKPLVEVSKPVVKVTKPVAEVTKPVVEVTKPVVEVTKPVVEVTKPVAEVTKPEPKRQYGPVSESTRPSAGQSRSFKFLQNMVESGEEAVPPWRSVEPAALPGSLATANQGSSLAGRDTIVQEPTERKTIKIPGYSATVTNNNNNDKVTMATERPQITVTPAAYRDVTVTTEERKKIVLPAYKGSPFGSRENLADDSEGGPKTYIPSETYKLVQEEDHADPTQGRRSPFGGGAKTQGKSFAMLQKQLDDPSSAGSPRGGGGRAPGYKAPGAVSAPSAPGRGVGGAPSAPGGVGGGGPKPAWAPTIPAGERKMKVGRSGDARRVNTQAGRVPVCSSCGVQIRGPFVSALDKTWCPDHFICANPQCQSPLIDQGFVEENNQLFCVRDYEQYFAPRCNKCTQAIIGEIVNALKQTFHMNCFLCSQCHQPIGAGSFHTEDSKIYCSKDWASMFQTKCYGCQFPVEPGDRWVEALNQNWHSECFNCSTCQVNLEGQSFFAKSGKPFCKKHASGGY